MLWGVEEPPAAPEFRPGELSTKFLQPPFSVLDTRKGDWQERRRAWLALGIQSELGRAADLLHLSPAEQARARWAAGDDPVAEPEGMQGAGTSVFDPVLCELAYRWWAPAGGAILDPFAGGSVRGIVAAKLGHPYTGVDLSSAQLAANRHQAEAILAPAEPAPRWIDGDSQDLAELLPAGAEYDMVFTCPPYHDLEVYSSDPRDLSTYDWAMFVSSLASILHQAAARLRDGRFAVVVVSEIRDREGYCKGLVPATIGAAEATGLRLYNEAVLINSVGSLPLRVGKYMEAGRKLGRAHQNVLCFLKGRPPRGWSYDRAAPPSPQLDLALLPPDDPAPPASAPGRPAADEPAAEAEGAPGDQLQQRASYAVNEPEEPWEPAIAPEEWVQAADISALPRVDPEAVAAGDTMDHPDGYLVDRTTGEILEFPAPEAPAAEAAPPPELAGCSHGAGFHRGAIEESACKAGTWWPGWPSVIPAGPPGSGATAPPRAVSIEEGTDHGDGEGHSG